MASLVAFRSAIRASRATLTASRAVRCSTAAGLSAAALARAARSSWAFFASAAALRRSPKLAFFDLSIQSYTLNVWRVVAQTVDGFRSALATPYSRAWTRPRLKSSRACRGGSLRRSSVCLSDEGTTSVERCRLRSADFPVALLLQSQNRTTEPVSNEHGPHTEESKRKKRKSAHPIRGWQDLEQQGEPDPPGCARGAAPNGARGSCCLKRGEEEA